MSEYGSEQSLKSWTDYLVDDVPKLFGLMFVFWLIVGTFPLWCSGISIEKSGQIGDMFGVANSLFSGSAFVVAMLALTMQIRETRESGERQLKQETLQTQQMQLAERTAEIQERTAIRQSQERIEAALSKVMVDAGIVHLKFRHLLAAYLRDFNNQNKPSDKIALVAEVRTAVAQLLANNPVLGLTCVDHATPLIESIGQWQDIPDRWELEHLVYIPAELIESLDKAQEEVSQQIATLGEEVVKVWKQYLLASWQNTRVPEGFIRSARKI